MRRAALPGLLALCTFPTAAAAADGTGGMSVAEPAVAAEAAPADPPASATAADTAAPTPAAGSAAIRGTVAAESPEGSGTWTVPSSTRVGQGVRVSGQVDGKLAGRTVRVERRTPSKRWMTATRAQVRSNGRFSVSWRTSSARYHDLRVVLNGSTAETERTATSAPATAPAAESLRVLVLDRARASWYGPGFYGSKTACGMVLGKATVGVAHRTLPCGTQVEVRYGGKSAVVPVIDRGPFANHAAFDLTKAVADQIGFDGVQTIQFAERPDLARLATPYRAPALNR